MDWRDCEDVERIPGTVSGAWVVKGTRVQADAIVENAREGYTAERIAADIFPSVPLDRIRRVMTYARLHEAHSA